jgi:hypothetical protein
MIDWHERGASMMATVLLYGLVWYIGIGVLTALLFVTFGISHVLPRSATVTLGARILFLPAAAALWPYVLLRWLTSRGGA